MRTLLTLAALTLCGTTYGAEPPRVKNPPPVKDSTLVIGGVPHVRGADGVYRAVVQSSPAVYTPVTDSPLCVGGSCAAPQSGSSGGGWYFGKALGRRR